MGELSVKLAQLLQQGPQLFHGGQNGHPKRETGSKPREWGLEGGCTWAGPHRKW